MHGVVKTSGGSRPVVGDAYRFDLFRVDLRRGVLLRDGHGELPLRPRSYELLLHMLQNPNKLLQRQDLLEGLWPGVVVTDDSLTQCISELRHVFGDRGAALLRTVPRRGYTLTASVDRERPLDVPEPKARPAERREPAVRQPSKRDVLILDPLKSAVDGGELQDIIPGLGAELLAAFSRSEILSVLTRPAGPQTGGHRLAGTLLRSGGGLVLSLVLDEVDSSRVIWAEQVALPEANMWRGTLLALVGRVEMLLSAEALQSARQKSLDELRPHDLVLLGRELHQRGDEPNTREAQQHFLKAIALAPDLAVAHGFHAFTVLRFITHGWGGKDRSPPYWDTQRRLAMDVARRAVELDPRSALCLSALAFALLQSRQWEEAVVTARLSLELSSLSAMGTRTACAEVLAAAGEAAEGVGALQATITLDPFCPPRSRAVLGRALLLADRTEDAWTELRRANVLLPDYAPCLRSMVVAAVELGRMEEARETVVQLRRVQPNWFPADSQTLPFLRLQRDRDRVLSAFAACEHPAEPGTS